MPGASSEDPASSIERLVVPPFFPIIIANNITTVRSNILKIEFLDSNNESVDFCTFSAMAPIAHKLLE